MSVPGDPTNRRAIYGWFGAQPWPSYVCYNDDGQVNEAMRIPVPVGHACADCQAPILPHDHGKAVPHIHETGFTITYVHKECLLVQVMGPLAHLDRRCPCYGGDSHATAGMTQREEARAVWERVAMGRF